MFSDAIALKGLASASPKRRLVVFLQCTIECHSYEARLIAETGGDNWAIPCLCLIVSLSLGFTFIRLTPPSGKQDEKSTLFLFVCVLFCRGL